MDDKKIVELAYITGIAYNRRQAIFAEQISIEREMRAKNIPVDPSWMNHILYSRNKRHIEQRESFIIACGGRKAFNALLERRQATFSDWSHWAYNECSSILQLNWGRNVDQWKQEANLAHPSVSLDLDDRLVQVILKLAKELSSIECSNENRNQQIHAMLGAWVRGENIILARMMMN